ncbi:8084_t:CDS:2, partial [Racocetra persica]
RQIKAQKLSTIVLENTVGEYYWTVALETKPGIKYCQLLCKHIYTVIICYFISSSTNIESPNQRQQKIQQSSYQQPSTTEKLIELSHALEVVHRPKKNFQTGNWVNEDL